jgi:hypothetical protein
LLSWSPDARWLLHSTFSATFAVYDTR